MTEAIFSMHAITFYFGDTFIHLAKQMGLLCSTGKASLKAHPLSWVWSLFPSEDAFLKTDLWLPSEKRAPTPLFQKGLSQPDSPRTPPWHSKITCQWKWQPDSHDLEGFFERWRSFKSCDDNLPQKWNLQAEISTFNYHQPTRMSGQKDKTAFTRYNVPASQVLEPRATGYFLVCIF